MRKFLALLVGALLTAVPAFADMYPDASNAKLPDAVKNFGLMDSSGNYYKFGTGLYPVYATATTTTATTTSGSPDIIVASPANISMGDSIWATFAPSTGARGTQVTNIVGNTVTMSQNATASGTGTAVRFGLDRFSPANTALTNVIAASQGYFGAASAGRSVWLNKYAPGADYLNGSAVLAISYFGGTGVAAASRDSDNPGVPGSAVIASAVNIISDSNTNWHSTWGNYWQSNLEGSAVGTHLQTESTIVSAWDPVALDPYVGNRIGNSISMRFGCGIEVGDKACTAPLHIIKATAPFESGIIFQEGSLVDGSAIQLPIGYGIDWFKSAGTKTWSVRSVANTSLPQTITLGDWMTLSSPLVISATNAAASHATGSLVTGGGLGVAGDSFLAGNLSLGDSKFICFAGDAACTLSNFAIFGAIGQTVINASTGGLVDLRINDVSKFLIDGSGNATFGAQMINAHLTTGANADTVCLKADGTFLIQAAACTISSLRFKNLIGDVAPEQSLERVEKLQPITFTMKDGEKPNADWNYNKPQIGLSAENVAATMPKCAIYEQDGKTPKSYRQECVIAELVGAVRAQQHQIEALRVGR